MNNTAKSDITDVEKYVVKTNQNLQYWLPDLQLTEADKELLLNPLGWLNDNHILMLLSSCSRVIVRKSRVFKM